MPIVRVFPHPAAALVVIAAAVGSSAAFARDDNRCLPGEVVYCKGIPAVCICIEAPQRPIAAKRSGRSSGSVKKTD